MTQINIFSRFFWGIAVTLAILGLIGICVSNASAQNKTEICSGANISFDQTTKCGQIINDQGKKKTSDPGTKTTKLVKNIVNLLSVVVGIAAVIMVIVGGFRFVTAGGDSAKIGTARNTIIYALIGVIIVAFAQILVKFVVGKASQG